MAREAKLRATEVAKQVYKQHIFTFIHNTYHNIYSRMAREAKLRAAMASRCDSVVIVVVVVEVSVW